MWSCDECAFLLGAGVRFAGGRVVTFLVAVSLDVFAEVVASHEAL